MNARRLIGFVLTLALLLSQTFVPLARAACGMPRGAAPPACSFCANAGGPEGGALLIADRSCCAVRKPAAERDPATVTSYRPNESRAEAGFLVVPTRIAAATPLVLPTKRREAPPPLFDSPHRTSTVLLI